LEEWPPPSAFIEEAEECVKTASAKSLHLRVMGGLAIFMHSREFQPLWEKLGRLGKKVFTDIDFVSYGKDRGELIEFFKGRNYFINQKMLYLYGKGRQIYYGKKIPMVEIFFDKLEMNHIVNFKNRLDADYPTIPLTELLLQKLQMVNINEKDIKDLIILLRAHEIGADDKDQINREALGSHLLSDWGFHYTATTNLKKIKDALGQYSALGDEDIKVVEGRLDDLLDYLENEPKSMKWKMRALVGTKMQWYNEVDEWDVIDSQTEDSKNEMT
jgi:hypothetical protein